MSSFMEVSESRLRLSIASRCSAPQGHHFVEAFLGIPSLALTPSPRTWAYADVHEVRAWLVLALQVLVFTNFDVCAHRVLHFWNCVVFWESGFWQAITSAASCLLLAWARGVL